MGPTACRHFCTEKGPNPILGYLFSRLLAPFWRLFDTFWFHLGPNWALEAWARDTWFFMDSEGGSKIHRTGVSGGKLGRLEPYYQLTISQLPPIYQANYLLPSTAEQQIQDYRTRPTNNSLVAPDKQGPADNTYTCDYRR